MQTKVVTCVDALSRGWLMKVTHGHPASDLPKLMKDADFTVFHGHASHRCLQ